MTAIAIRPIDRVFSFDGFVSASECVQNDKDFREFRIAPKDLLGFPIRRFVRLRV